MFIPLDKTPNETDGQMDRRTDRQEAYHVDSTAVCILLCIVSNADAL